MFTKHEQTFSDFVDCDIVEAHLLSMWTQCALRITKEIFLDGSLLCLLHERIISIHATTRFVQLDESNRFACTCSMTGEPLLHLNM